MLIVTGGGREHPLDSTEACYHPCHDRHDRYNYDVHHHTILLLAEQTEASGLLSNSSSQFLKLKKVFKEMKMMTSDQYHQHCYY